MLWAFVVFNGLASAAIQPNFTCQMTPSYPPPANSSVEWYELNLDLPAAQRWVPLVTSKAKEIAAMINTMTQDIPEKILTPLLEYCAKGAKTEFLDRFPEDYGAEIQSIADATNIPVCEIIIYNLAYEVLGGCTSIVAQDAAGDIIHGRNLDFGMGPFNFTEGQWELTDALRPLIYNVNFTRGGKTVFTGVHYAGYIGVLTHVKKGAFSLSIDSRFDDTYEHYLVQWLKNKKDNANFLSFLTRQAFETQNTYADAVEFLSHHVMVGPSYVIVAGLEKGEGCVITNEPNDTKSLDVWPIAQGLPPGGSPFYVLQTNYDHWVKPPFFDNRQTSAEDCMKKLGPTGISKETMYNVLHAEPNRNRLTTFTTLLQAKTGLMETSLQWCTELPGCWPW